MIPADSKESKEPTPSRSDHFQSLNHTINTDPFNQDYSGKMPKRQRYDWANRTDPETGEPTRFCTRCEDFLTLDRFYPCHLKRGTLLCKTHIKETTRTAQRNWKRKARGKAGSVARLRQNTNQWISRRRISSTFWSVADVKAALQKHNIDLQNETQAVLLRPCNPDQAFTVENSIVRYRKFGSGIQQNTTQTSD